jgi:hypothetical protein
VTVAVRIDPVAVLDDFIERCEAAARRWQAGYRQLHDAVDGLQAEAAANGLVDSIGQDAVQAIIAAAFAKVREDPAEDAWNAPGWRDAAVEYHSKRGNRVTVTDIEPERLAQLRALMADDVSLERAQAELNSNRSVPTATLQAAEFLVREGDRERMRRWLAKHTTEEQAAIVEYLKRRRGAK